MLLWHRTPVRAIRKPGASYPRKPPGVPATTLLCIALNFTMFYNLFSCVVSCDLQTLNIYIKKSNAHHRNKRGMLNPRRANCVKWLGNLGGCNNHKDFPPAFSLGPGGLSRLECSACKVGTKILAVPAVSMSLACAVRMYRSLAGNQDVLPAPLRSQGLLLLSNTDTFFF